ncbi:MAG: YraN family protein [Candidatus Omnitrophica bacterium]|nr:YraN family protein [Candidatus Omnitrophota bacterium]
MKGDFRKKLGRDGEDIAVRFLKQKGMRIIERNFSCRLGEIDIIAMDDDSYVIVEVRSTSSYSFIDPLESIGAMKMKRLERLASAWLMSRDMRECNIRFDVVAIVFDKFSGTAKKPFFGPRRVEVRHFKGII